MCRFGFGLGRRVGHFSFCMILIAVSHIVWRTGKAESAFPLTQPQIIVQDGNIYFLPAQHKNLILKTSGKGKLVFNNIELDNLISLIHNSSRDLNSFQSIFGSSSSSSTHNSGHPRNENIEQTIQRLNQIESLEARLTVIERRVLATNGSDSEGDSRDSNRNRIRRLTNRIEALENRLNGGASSGENPCNANPCRNGGICIPTIYGAFCYCLKGWEGDRCDHDINECWNFAGTELGCQNGATCVNQPGSYQCQCISGFIGQHCTTRSGGCSSASGWELCGHGICIDQNHAGSSQYKYACICDVGWTDNGRTPACTVDIDECSQYHTTCSRNPPVSCINTPGSYVCGPCPSGYSGNGHHCTDVNECLVNNGGCSVNPMVQCINTVGSKSCGSCPPGYMGTGVTCQYVGLCQMNNGGCYPLARCVENPMIGQSFVQCVCPAGYTGPGIGLHGCISIVPSGSSGGIIIPTVPPSGDFCLPNPCENGGVCHSYGVTFSCSCPSGFVGPTCSTRVNPCLSQPCQNGGSCQQTSTGFTCTCPSAFTGDFCERQTESCGGSLFTEEGSLKYPQSQGTYDHRTFCEWQLLGSAGKVFNVTFTRFHLEGGHRCGYDYLEIRDGRDSQSPLFGRFCGEELPLGGNIISTHNALHLTFRSDHSVVGLGFELSWNSTEPGCGGLLENQEQAHGSIQSPGYPGSYPHNRDCTWQIKASLGKRIQLVFATFQLEVHRNCSFDYVEVLDGLEETAATLAKLCSKTLPAPVTSSGPYLTVRFHSDDSGSDSGFLITYSEVAGVPGCGGLLTSAAAIFSSPQHPEPYPHGLECDWLIRLPAMDDRISLQFITFELEESLRSCSYDYVEIYDGPSLESPLLGRFCGGSLPPTLTSSSNRLFVRFKSDESLAMGGFSAKYEAVCGGEITSPDGIIRSPYYPSNYPKLRDCIYVISQPAGKGINLQFLDFDIEPGTDEEDCLFDYLEIRDGDNDNSTLIGHYCGPPQAAPETIMSSYNYLWLRFKTDGSIQNRGFMANFSTFETGCGGIMRTPTGVIQSPGHPEVYPHGLRCMWVIRGEPGQIVRLTWDMFSLEGGSNCIYDYVEVYDNATSTANGSLIGKFCGSVHPPIITSLDTTLTIIFKSDHSESYDGFMASYQFLNVSTACGGNYFTEYGMLKSPRYPDNYPNGRTCIWVITAPRGRQIELNIMDFAMENGTSSGCRYDYLEIRNGPFETSPLVGKFCGGRSPPSRIPSFSNSLYLKFKTDPSHARRGFQIIWDATATGCGGVLHSPSGSISSPNYPSPHEGGMECLWKIQVNQGNLIQLIFVDLDLQRPSSTQCWGEHVEVLDGTQRYSPSLGRFCSEDQVIPIQSTGNSLTLKLVGSVLGGGGGRGFLLNYKISCNRTLKGFHGVIESPNYPNPYPHNRNCTWTIQAGRGNKVNISFSHFDVEAPLGVNCSYDFVQIIEWEWHMWRSYTKTAVGTYCGSSRPGLISSTKNTVAISFLSDHSQAGNGFRLEWANYGCGGRINTDWAELKSPDYPTISSRNVECVWEVTTEPGTKVQLTVYHLDSEGSNCDWDSLEVYGGSDETSPLVSKICFVIRESSPTILSSFGNRMYIRFQTDGLYAGKGFYGIIGQLPGGCGGTLQSKSGYIHSPNYPRDYEPDDDCSWLVRTDENHVVELTFEDFVVERHINCSYDHVAIYDGTSTTAPLLLMHCGTELPEPNIIRSSGNEMLIHLKTDGSGAGRGFKASYKQGCGARIKGRQSGEITSPNYPGRMLIDGSANCSWIIEGEPDDRVTLTFTFLEFLSGDEECNDIYLEVLDGDHFGAPSLYKGCSGGVPPAFTSRGNAMILHAVASHYHGDGFRAIFDLSSSACGGTFITASGSFTSPNYSNGYPPNVECIWVVRAAPGNHVQMSFRRFDIEPSEFCNSDFVEIHEGSAGGPLMGHYCGNKIPNNITAVEKLWVMFRTDGEGQAPGFWADFNLVHGVELSGSQGSIASPMYPETYRSSDTFTWLVTVNETYGIQIDFSHYQMDPYDYGENCENYDTIKIFDGPDENAPVLLTACSRTMPDPVVSTGNVVYVQYARHGWFTSFLLKWQQVQASFGGTGAIQPNITGCGGNFLLDNSTTTLLNPEYPLGHHGSLNCNWTFEAPPSYRIRLTLINLLMESHPTKCIFDRVELYDGVRGLPNYQLNKTLCQWNEQNNTYWTSGRFLRVFFVKWEHSYFPTFNFSLTTECGGYVRGPAGSISSPNFPNNYEASNCIWKVIVRPGRTIRIKFLPHFGIYSSGGQCVTDQLILRSGENDESPFLGSGRYCGDTAPGDLETNANHLYVHFTSMTHGGMGFGFKYEEVSLGCGGTIQLNDLTPGTIIQSPNHPQMPPPYTECEWVFTVAQGKAIQINFLEPFDIARSPGWMSCASAGVEIRDGGTAIAPVLGTFCQEIPGTVKSTGNIMYIRYYTNVPEPRNGFKAEVQIATCGGLHAGYRGTIAYPSLPALYELDQDCLWTIRVRRGSGVHLEFRSFNLGMGNDNCTTGDKLIITEMGSPDMLMLNPNPRNWTFCGNYSETIETAGNEIQIRFVNDGRRQPQETGLGFQLTYWHTYDYCQEDLETPSGVITSPLYPQPYPNNQQCHWFIHAPAGRRIRLEFTDFDLERQFPKKDWRWNCTLDYFTIFQGVRREMRKPLYNTSLCGSSLPPPVESTGGELTIYFGSNRAIAGRGFKVSYTTDLPSLCGGRLEEGEGVITSPNTTTGTPNETNGVFCEWKTGSGSSGSPEERSSLPGNGTIIITLHSLQLPSWASEVKDPYCNHGFLRFAPDGDFYARYKWRRLCGSIRDEKMYLPGRSFAVEYNSDDMTSSFNISYRIAPCGGKLQGPEENLTSLNYPSPYPPNTECIWVVEFSPGSQVKLTFYDMDLDDHQGTAADDGCDRDYITIRNGEYPSSPQMGKYCGSYMPSEITSMSNHLWIEFHSDGRGDGNRRGFNLGLEELSKGCGGVVHAKYGKLTSPVKDSGGSLYPDNTECQWIIESIPGYSVNLVFVERFDMETSVNCTNDYVEVFEKVSLDWVSKARFCGRQLPPPINTTGSSVKVIFKSNANINGNGFNLYWYSPCGGVYTEPSGVIRSAHFDYMKHIHHVDQGEFRNYMGWESNYQVRRCEYVITGHPDDYILIQYLEPFEIAVPTHWTINPDESEVNAGCPRVNLTMWQGTPTTVERLSGTICGRVLPEPFVARGSVVLSYNYMGSYENYGFRAQYSRFECGGEITTSRRVHSPGHPFTSASNMNCTWVVRGPPERVVRFTFLFLEMEYHRECTWDSVRLYDGPFIDETKRIGTYCGNLTDDMPKISSRSNAMTIYFTTDMVIEHRGFEGAVEFTLGEGQGCGGTKNLTAGQFTLSGLDTRQNNLDCQWLLVAQQFKSVELNFTSFDLGGDQGASGNPMGSCQLNFAEIRDGPGPHGQLLAKLCGSSLPSPIMSSLHFMWIRFVTDGSRHARGFNFTAREISTPCSQLVYSATDTWQYLTSPGYPSNYDNNFHCRWRIDSAAEYEQVDITFTELDIEASPDCLKDGLEISDVSNSYFTPEGITGPILFTGNGISDWKFQNLNLSRDSIYQKFKYCGSETPPDFFSVGQSAEIVFQSDGTNTGKGFKIGFKVAGCNRTYEKFQGRIFSLEWPGRTPMIANCFSSIIAPNGSTIALYFNAFSLPVLAGETGCAETALQIRDGSPSGPILAQYCGTSIPDPVFSLSNILYLQFFSRNQIRGRQTTMRGYDITYTTTDMGRGCGGNIFHTGGSLTSPLYPGNYSLDKDCVWRIRVPAGLRIQLQFTNFIFGGDCQINFIEISSLDSHDQAASPILFSRFCSGDVPGVYNGNTDMVVVRYKTSANNTGAGWRLIFKGVYPTNVPIGSQ